MVRQNKGRDCENGKMKTERKLWKITASSKKMRETSTREQMRDQRTKDKYQQ